MKTVGKSATYDPTFSANYDGIAFCPKCERELSEADDKTAETKRIIAPTSRFGAFLVISNNFYRTPVPKSPFTKGGL